MSYEKEEDERSEINWDRFAVRGAKTKYPVDKIKSTDYRQQTTDNHPDGAVVR